MKNSPQIFLSYVNEDREKVDELYRKLSDAGFKPWMDKRDILAGENWSLSIQQAIRDSDFFLVCLSSRSVTKRGFFQVEMRKALDIWQEKLESDNYLIPARLEDCEVPESLRRFQWVNLFKKNGSKELLRAIRGGWERRKKEIKTAITKENMDNGTNKKNGEREKANHHIKILRNMMWVLVYKDKRVIKHQYTIQALEDVEKYRFKVMWSRSVKVKVTCPDFNLNQIFDQTDKKWQKYEIQFHKPIKKGKSVKFNLIFAIPDKKHNAFPYQSISYANVVGCNNLRVVLLFAEPPLPEAVYLTMHSQDLKPPEQEIPIACEDIDKKIRLYWLDIKPKSEIKYHIDWRFDQKANTRALVKT